MSDELRDARSYRVDLSADGFEQLLRDDEVINFCEGEPRRELATQFETKATAWRVDDTFVLTRPAISPVTVDPPALVLRFEPDQTVHMHAQLSLGTLRDKISQHGGEIMRRGALRTGLVGVGFATSLVTLVTGTVFAALIILWTSMLWQAAGEVLLVLAPFAVLLASVWVFARTAFSPIVNHERLAWQIGLPQLAEMSGRLLTPHILGAAEPIEPVPYRIEQS